MRERDAGKKQPNQTKITTTTRGKLLQSVRVRECVCVFVDISEEQIVQYHLQSRRNWSWTTRSHEQNNEATFSIAWAWAWHSVAPYYNQCIYMKNIYFMFLFRVILLMLFHVFCLHFVEQCFLSALKCFFVFRDNNDLDGCEAPHLTWYGAFYALYIISNKWGKQQKPIFLSILQIFRNEKTRTYERTNERAEYTQCLYMAL